MSAIAHHQQTAGPGGLSVARMCRATSISRSAYYRWRSQSHEPTDVEAPLRAAIHQVSTEFTQCGIRTTTRHLKRSGMEVGRDRVGRIMREEGLLVRPRKRFVATTDSDHNDRIWPNLIRDFTPSGLDQLWVADITYIALERQFVYLAAILDAFSRRCIGWNLASTLRASLTLQALRMALAQRNVRAGLIHHSDRGVQYACGDYVALLQEHRIRVSMSRRACPWDNAQAESFFKTLKYEEVHLWEYADEADARSRIGQFIEEVYNAKRLHSALDYVPPAEFEAAWATSTQGAIEVLTIAGT